MARIKKNPEVIEENIQETPEQLPAEKPQNVVISVPLPIEFEEGVPTLAPVIEPVIVEDDIDDVELEKTEYLYYEVFDQSEYLVAALDGSDELLSYIDSNKTQLEDWVNELNEEITDLDKLFSLNYPGVTNLYSSILQYQNQNGLAPIGPKVKSLMEFHKDTTGILLDEEVAIAVYGNLRYSFVPIKLML